MNFTKLIQIVTRAEAPAQGNLRAHLIKGAAGSFVLQLSFAGFGFLNAIILARVLGAGGYGSYANAMAWVSLLIIPATFGFGVLLVRDTAAYRTQQKWIFLKGLLQFSNGFVLLWSTIIACVAAIIAGFVFPSPAQTSLRLTLWVALPLVPLLAIHTLQQSTIRGLEYIFRAQFPGAVIRPGALLIGLSLIYLLKPSSLSASTAMRVNIGATTLALGAGIFWLLRLLPPEVKKAVAKYQFRSWLQIAFPMMVHGGMQTILGLTDVVMLGVMRGAEDVGLYATASRLAYLLVYVLYATEMVMAPVMSRMFTEGGKERLQKIVTKAVRISFYCALPLGLVFMLFGGSILNIFGARFVSAKIALMILVLGRLIEIGLGSGALLLAMTGSERTVAKTFAAITLTNIILNAILIPLYSIEGAAIASMVCVVSAKYTLSYFARKRAKIDTTIWRIQR